MKNRFKTLWIRCGARSDADQVVTDLNSRYSEPHRFYHNLSHIENCLVQLDRLPAETGDTDALEVALWFHDAIYDLFAHDNEEKSAALARAVCGEASLPSSFCTSVHELIMMTKHTVQPSRYLEKVMVDIDLAILGAEPLDYERFEAAIRREYAHVNESDFASGRGSILSGFLKRPRIYYSDFFFNAFEKQARNNLLGTVEALTSRR